MALNFPVRRQRSLCMCKGVMGKEEEGREILQCLIYYRMEEGKSFRNVNSASNLERSNVV